MEAIVFIILQIFFATRAIFKIGEYSRIFHSFGPGIFGHVTHLNQSRASEKIWWIIRADSGPPRISTIAPRDQFKTIRIVENLVVNYKGW